MRQKDPSNDQILRGDRISDRSQIQEETAVHITQKRWFTYKDGIVSEELYWDADNFLRDKRGEYPSPECACNFVTKVDVSNHIGSWHRPGGLYYNKDAEPGESFYVKGAGYIVMCNERAPPKKFILPPITQAEAQKKIPLDAFV